jgi:hypothetical protein
MTVAKFLCPDARADISAAVINSDVSREYTKSSTRRLLVFSLKLSNSFRGRPRTTDVSEVDGSDCDRYTKNCTSPAIQSDHLRRK